MNENELKLFCQYCKEELKHNDVINTETNSGEKRYYIETTILHCPKCKKEYIAEIKYDLTNPQIEELVEN